MGGGKKKVLVQKKLVKTNIIRDIKKAFFKIDHGLRNTYLSDEVAEGMAELAATIEKLPEGQ